MTFVVKETMGNSSHIYHYRYYTISFLQLIQMFFEYSMFARILNSGPKSTYSHHKCNPQDSSGIINDLWSEKIYV